MDQEEDTKSEEASPTKSIGDDESVMSETSEVSNPISSPQKKTLTDDSNPHMSGYLYKKTKDGRWQRRWFETNGIYLTYYKSRKMEKLLAALSLPQVGDISKVTNEGESGLFTIDLNSRIYTLRARNDEDAEAWVSTLLKLRQIGTPTNSTDRPASDKSTMSQAFDAIEHQRSEWMKSGKSVGTCCC